MPHSTVTSKGQTTIPGEIREALNIKPGDRLQYQVESDYIVVRIHPGTLAVKGILASAKGKDLSFAQIRGAAASQRARDRRK
jgi:AbrB family looped-hinge helix DNA binding protein